MSDNWLQFIPSDTKFQPTREAAEKAKALLASVVPRAEKVSVEFKDSVTFFHPMGNWSGVECPVCGKDVEEWWREAMDAAAKRQFEDLMITTPCCGSKVSLNDMRYVWPAAFGRFVLEAMNPDVTDISADDMKRLSHLVNCGLRRVWVHI